jgi:exocyst complex protein 7
MLASVVASHRRTDELAGALEKMDSTTEDGFRCCEMLTRRARQLDSLTSPASDSSSMLSRANANLAATLVLMKDAREKFDTVQDCEPAIERLDKGVKDLDVTDSKKKKGSLKNRVVLSEQDVYAAGDSMEILRDAYDYFEGRGSWRSTPNTLTGLERLHKMGTDAMCLLVRTHLKKAGHAVRPKRNMKKEIHPAEESAQQVLYATAICVMDFTLL